MPRSLKNFIQYERMGKTLIVLNSLKEVTELPDDVENFVLIDENNVEQRFYFNPNMSQTSHNGTTVIAKDKEWSDDEDTWKTPPTSGQGCYVSNIVTTLAETSKIVEVATSEELKAELEKVKDGKKFVGGHYKIRLTTPTPYVYDLSDYDLNLQGVGTRDRLLIIDSPHQNYEAGSEPDEDYQLKIRSITVRDSSFYINLDTKTTYGEPEKNRANTWVEFTGFSANENYAPDDIIHRNRLVKWGVDIYRSYFGVRGLVNGRAYMLFQYWTDADIANHTITESINPFIYVLRHSWLVSKTLVFDTMYVKDSKIQCPFIPTGKSYLRDVATKSDSNREQRDPMFLSSSSLIGFSYKFMEYAHKKVYLKRHLEVIVDVYNHSYIWSKIDGRQVEDGDSEVDEFYENDTEGSGYYSFVKIGANIYFNVINYSKWHIELDPHETGLAFHYMRGGQVDRHSEYVNEFYDNTQDNQSIGVVNHSNIIVEDPRFNCSFSNYSYGINFDGSIKRFSNDTDVR